MGRLCLTDRARMGPNVRASREPLGRRPATALLAKNADRLATIQGPVRNRDRFSDPTRGFSSRRCTSRILRAEARPGREAQTNINGLGGLPRFQSTKADTADSGTGNAVGRGHFEDGLLLELAMNCLSRGWALGVLLAYVPVCIAKREGDCARPFADRRCEGLDGDQR